LVVDGGQVDAGVPVSEYIDVRRYTLELSCGEDNRDSRFPSACASGQALTGPLARFGMTRV
jgi:hypothetical protein